MQFEGADGSPSPSSARKLIEPFDPIDLLQRSAALQLCPENAQRLFRLEYLSTIVASLPGRNAKPRISANRLRRLVEGGLGIAHLEDPVTWPFAESLAFIGGDYLVLPGLTERLRPGLDLLLAASLLDPELEDLKPFRAAIAHSCQALFRLSDAMCHAAGLTRGQAPHEDHNLVVPTGDRFQRLIGAVTWSIEELTELLEGTNLLTTALQPFEIGLDVAVPPDSLPGHGRLVQRPLVRDGDRIIVALPHALPTALSQFVLDTAHQHGALQRLSDAFLRASVSMVSRALDMMGLPLLRQDQQPDTQLPYTSEQFRWLDVDKILHVIVICDDLGTYSPSVPFGDAAYPSGTQLDARFRSGLGRAGALRDGPGEILGLLVTSGVARQAIFGLEGGSTDQEVLPAHISDLVALSYLEPHNPLYLWHFSRSRLRLQRAVEVMAWSLADELFFYRKNDSSFYLTDDQAPTLISFQPNAGGALLLEAYQRFDPHAIRASRGGFQDCIRVYPNSRIPIYLPRFPSLEEPAQCVETDHGVIWVRTRLNRTGPRHLGHEMAIRLVDAIAFWLGQMKRAGFVGSAASANLAIEVHAVDPHEWRYPEAVSNDEPHDPGVLVERADQRTIRVLFPPGTMNVLASSRGREEHLLLAPLFRWIAQAFGYTAKDAEVALDVTLPTPLHRRLVPVSSRDTAAAIRRHLPPKHLVAAAAEQEVLDEIKDLLVTEGVGTGPIAAEQRTSVLNCIVKRLFERLQQVIAELSPHELIEWLIKHNEAVVDEHSMALHMEPYSLACFGEEAGPAKEFADRLVELYKADQACRFLIEYVAACPPSGRCVMSYGTYDQLLALSSKIIFYGMLSDDIKYGCDDPDLSVLESGRLGLSGSRRQATRDRYLTAFGSGKRARLMRLSQGSDPEWIVIKRQRAVEAIEAASKDEFGFSLTQHSDIMAMAMEQSLKQGHAVAVLPKEAFLAAIADECGVDRQRAVSWLAALSLEPRDDFFTVPEPAKRHDVYPWKYNRALSYVRRPFVITDENILFGSSHVERSARYLGHLCLSGRLKAVTPGMRVAIGMATELSGQRFNRTIAEIFRSSSNLIVRERIDRFKGVHLASEAGPLGDVDVLVADSRKRRLRAYECKDLSVGRTPSELHNELKKLIGGDKSIVAKHQRRVEWIKANLKVVLQELNVTPREKWDIKGVLILDEELLGPFLVDLPIKAVSIAEVEATLKAGRAIP